MQNDRPWFLNPGVVFYSTWLGVWFLYSLHLSRVLIYPSNTVSRLEFPLLAGFLPFLLITYLIPHKTVLASASNPDEITARLDRKLKLWLLVWIGITCIEVVVSGGIPIVWTLTGSSKTYFDFGIPTVHGFMNALILSISVTRFALGLQNGKKRDLFFPALMLVWTLVVETRQLIIVVLLECTFLFLMYRRIRAKQLLSVLGVALLFVVIFGISGDIRSGGEAFRQLAQPTDQYPTWLPSGFLWVYIYMTTPLNNLVNTWVNVQPLHDITMPNTLAQLIPTAVRNLFGLHGDSMTWSGDLVTEAFNVSTAYVGPVQDLGIWGVLGFSGFAAFSTGIYWMKRGMRNNLIYAVLGQCLFLTIFFNHFLFLPIIVQIGWMYVFFAQPSNGVANVKDLPERREVHSV